MDKKAFLIEQVSAIIECKALVKYKDPSCLLVSIVIEEFFMEKALLNVGASLYLFSYSVYKQLDFASWKEQIKITLSLADHSLRFSHV